MTEQDKATRFVQKLVHDAHRRYQRQQLRPDAVAMPSSEIRGCKREPSRRERDAVFNPAWFTGLRPNFWKAYFETLTFLQR